LKNSFEVSKEERFITCIHESAHAVIHSLCKSLIVELVEVAPIGANNPSILDSNGCERKEYFGICRMNGSIGLGLLTPIMELSIEDKLFLEWDEDDISLMEWNEDSAMYDCLKADYNKALDDMAKCRVDKEFERREVRGCIAGSLAGYIAEYQFRNELDDVVDLVNDLVDEGRGDLHHDVTFAAGLSDFLPYRHELELLAEETERVINEPEILKLITGLAKELEVKGRIDREELVNFLPECRDNWPPSPRITEKKSIFLSSRRKWEAEWKAQLKARVSG